VPDFIYTIQTFHTRFIQFDGMKVNITILPKIGEFLLEYLQFNYKCRYIVHDIIRITVLFVKKRKYDITLLKWDSMILVNCVILNKISINKTKYTISIIIMPFFLNNKFLNL